MRLSEAMLRGCILRPQGFGAIFGVSFDGLFGWFGNPIATSCALGAAYQYADIQIGVVKNSDRTRSERGGVNGNAQTAWRVPHEWFALLFESGSQKCPQCHKEIDNVGRAIAHLNDHHRWPREAIACWLMPIEREVEGKTYRHVMSDQKRLEALRDTPPDTWIALSEDESRVVARAGSYVEVVEIATKEGEDDPVLIKTPESGW